MSNFRQNHDFSAILIFGEGIVILMYFLKPDVPEAIEKWIALLWKLVSFVTQFARSVSDFAHKRYSKHDLQGRGNQFIKGTISREAPYLEAPEMEIEFVEDGINRESFLEEGKVVLRLRRDDPEELNFVHAVFMFISESMLFRVKRYLSPTQRTAIDLFVTTKMLQKEKPHVLGYFLDEYMFPITRKKNSKILPLFVKFQKIDQGGLFFSVLLQELEFLGLKVFGQQQDDRIITEVGGFINFLETITIRPIGEEIKLEFKRDYCRCAVVIVGKPAKLNTSIEPYVSFINQYLVPENMETLYIVALWDNQTRVDEVCHALDGGFDKVAARKTKAILHYGDREEEREQYIVVLRNREVEVFQIAV